MAFSLLLLAGCGKEEPASSAVDPSSPESYMKDPEFRGKLKALRKKRVEIEEGQEYVDRRMSELVAAKMAELKTSSREQAIEALKDNPEWKTLVSRQEDAARAVRENRAQALAKVRARVMSTGGQVVPQKKAISK